MCLFWWVELGVTRVSGPWEVLIELNVTCWKSCKARLPMRLMDCSLPGRTLLPWQPPAWEGQTPEAMGDSSRVGKSSSQPLLGDALGQAVPEGYREGGEAFSLRKEHGVSKCRNKTAATKWSNFCMMLLFPGLYRCGTFFTSCSAVKCTC